MAKPSLIGNRGPAPLIGKAAPKKKRRKPSVTKKMVAPRKKRRKVSGIGEELPKMLELGVAAAAGGFVGRVVLKMGMLAPSGTSTTDYRPYAGVAAGIAGMLFIKNPTAKAAALGLTAVSAMGLVPDADIPQIGSAAFPRLTVGNSRPQIIRLKNGKRNNMNGARMIAGSAHSVSPLIGRKPKNNFFVGGVGLDL